MISLFVMIRRFAQSRFKPITFLRGKLSGRLPKSLGNNSWAFAPFAKESPQLFCPTFSFSITKIEQLKDSSLNSQGLGSDNSFVQLRINQKKTFIDKSMILKQIYNDVDPIVFLMPRRWGKSVLLSMIWEFYRLRTYQNGKKIETNSEFSTKALFAGGEYKMIQDGLIKTFELDALKISQDPKWNSIVIDQGKIPAIFLNLKSNTNNSLLQSIKQVVTKLLLLYKSFPYLGQDSYPKYGTVLSEMKNMSESYKKNVKKLEKALQLDQFKKITSMTSSCLLQLVQLLHYFHHKSKVMILIDEMDNPIDSLIDIALKDPTNMEKQQHVINLSKYLCQLYGSVGKGSQKIVKKVVFCGVYHTLLSDSNLNNARVKSILSPLEHIDLFGFTEEEVKHYINTMIWKSDWFKEKMMSDSKLEGIHPQSQKLNQNEIFYWRYSKDIQQKEEKLKELARAQKDQKGPVNELLHLKEIKSNKILSQMSLHYSGYKIGETSMFNPFSVFQHLSLCVKNLEKQCLLYATISHKDTLLNIIAEKIYNNKTENSLNFDIDEFFKKMLTLIANTSNEIDLKCDPIDKISAISWNKLTEPQFVQLLVLDGIITGKYSNGMIKASIPNKEVTIKTKKMLVQPFYQLSQKNNSKFDSFFFQALKTINLDESLDIDNLIKIIVARMGSSGGQIAITSFISGQMSIIVTHDIVREERVPLKRNNQSIMKNLTDPVADLNSKNKHDKEEQSREKTKRSDLVLYPREDSKAKNMTILEVKKAKKFKEIQQNFQEAWWQTHDRNYFSVILNTDKKLFNNLKIKDISKIEEIHLKLVVVYHETTNYNKKPEVHIKTLTYTVDEVLKLSKLMQSKNADFVLAKKKGYPMEIVHKNRLIFLNEHKKDVKLLWKE